MNEKITNEELMQGRLLAAELEAAKARAEAAMHKFNLHIAGISRKYNLTPDAGIAEDGTIVRSKGEETK